MEKLTQQIIEFVFGLRGPTVYVLVGVFAWGEAAFFLGLVMPGELTIAVAGMLASLDSWRSEGSLARPAWGPSCREPPLLPVTSDRSRRF